MEKVRRLVIFGMFLLIMLSLVPFASAFGIAVSYWEPDNSLRLQPGESTDISFRLQNAAGEGEDILLKAELIEGGEIATIIDETTEYFVLAGSEGVKTNIRVSIPEDIPLGTKYKVAVSYTQIAENEGKMVQVAAKIVQNIPVVVGDETFIAEEPQFAPESGISTIVWVILVVLVIVVILYFLLKRKK